MLTQTEAETQAAEYLARAAAARKAYFELCSAAFDNPGLSDTLLRAARSYKTSAAVWLRLAAQTKILRCRSF